MKFFFNASIQGKPQLEATYQVIENEVKRLGHEVDSGAVMDNSVGEMKEWNEQEFLGFHKSVMNSMKKADAMILEASYPSTGAGFNLAAAIQLGKPVIIFYSGDHEPHIFRTLEKINDKVQIIRYTSLDHLKKEIAQALAFASDSQDTRFNFFISPEHAKYLDWIAQTYKMSRSVYLRKLINQEMDKMVDEFSMNGIG
jgi:hypothetical protein